MARLIYAAITSLDGYMSDRDGKFEPCDERLGGFAVGKVIFDRSGPHPAGGEGIARGARRQVHGVSTAMAGGTRPRRNACSASTSLPCRRKARARTHQWIFTSSPS